MEHTKLKQIFNKYYKDESNIEYVIQKLKDTGASQMECTKTLIFELKMSLSEANEVVLKSKAWMENCDYIYKLRNEFIGGLTEIN